MAPDAGSADLRYELASGHAGVSELGSLGARDCPDDPRCNRTAIFRSRSKVFPGVRSVRAHVTLSDGSPVTLDIRPTLMPFAEWLAYVLVTQLLLLILSRWLAVRFAIRPLLDFAEAAEAFEPSKRDDSTGGRGPTEVVYAATAFNTMRDRIAHYLEERVQILAAISHDLQTPITRMKLRAEMAEDGRKRSGSRMTFPRSSGSCARAWPMRRVRRVMPSGPPASI